MANRIKLKGTSERSFDIGLGPKQTFDANNLTANRTWVLPDSNGTAGYVLSTNGSGNLSWVAQTGGGGGSSQARIEFTAAINGTGQTFTNAGISSFTNNTFANVFVNGVLLQTSEYSISGTTLTVSRYLSTGDNVIIAATSPGSVSGTLATTSGGTGLNTYTTGDTVYASATNTLAKLPIGTTGQVLTVSGGLPSWQTPSSSGGFSGVSRTSVLNLTSGAGTEQIVSSVYALPSISAGMAFKAIINLVAISTSSTITIRIRCGSTGTLSDTLIFNTSHSANITGMNTTVIEATIVFNSTTSILPVFWQQKVHLGAISGVPANALNEFTDSSGVSGLTSTNMIITAEPAVATGGQYFRINQAMITRIL